VSIILLSRFKNERHILYEWVHHHLAEDIDKILLIDHGSDDDYQAYNGWIDSLVDLGKLEIVKSVSDNQRNEYDHFLSRLEGYDWVIQIDLDEFVFCPQPNRSLKDVLAGKYRDTDYIQVHWKMFSHKDMYQPKSVIENNLITHGEDIDPTSPNGMKCIAQTRFLRSVKIHRCEFSRAVKSVRLQSHNSNIQLNHYRVQSDEFQFGVKEQRGGGASFPTLEDIKKKLDLHKSFTKEDTVLRKKRQNLILQCNSRPQVRPKAYENSYWNRHILKNGPV